MSSRLETVQDKLKMSGIRMTPQRNAILSYLLEVDTHPTVDEIYRAIEAQFPCMSVATIYNNLRVFLEAGLVKEMKFGDGASRFDADMSNHYHAVCNNCGKIQDFDYEPLHEVEKAAAAETGFEVTGHRLEVYGLCPDCKSKGSVH